MRKFTGKIKQIIPFKGEIKKINSFVGKFIENYKQPIYDNELPIEWDLNEIKHSGNPTLPDNKLYVKISSYVPTADELFAMKINLTIVGDAGQRTLELIGVRKGEGYGGYESVEFRSTELNFWVYLLIVPAGGKIPYGLYWFNDGYITLFDQIYSLYVPVEEPDIPDTPAATSYLYGRVAAEGETPDVIIDGVGYVGAVLPNIDEVYTDELKQTHPNAVIVNQYTVPYLYFCAAPYPYYDKAYYQVFLAAERSLSSTMRDGAWGEVFENPILNITTKNVLWSSIDIKDTDDTVYVQGTDPIPVYE